MNYSEACDWVFGFTDYELTPLSAAAGAALKLDRPRALLAELDHPERCAKAVHITGSKGKGSTARMVAALLEASGARTGLYTSPHLHTPLERIAIDGLPISEAEFSSLATSIRPIVERQNARSNDGPLTTFELLTALAFLAFREHHCDWQVVEVGLGGTLDATNVLDQKALCIFTPISLEHTAILGPTVGAIAGDKAGILRAGTRAVMAPQEPAAAEVLHSRCETLAVPCVDVEEKCSWIAGRRGLDGQLCLVRTPLDDYEFFLPLLGGHQVENATTAILAAENLAGDAIHLDSATVAKAFEGMTWPGRLEVLSRQPLVLVDGAHNGASAARLAEALAEICRDGRLTLIVGTLDDKDLTGIAQALAPVATRVIAAEPSHPRARPREQIAQAFRDAGLPARISDNVSTALRTAIAEASRDDAICVCGSLYVVAEARAELLGARA